jgi:hypothetical protein
MSAPPTEPDPDAAKAERRKKLVGRLAVIGLGLLIALYLAPMFIRLANGEH